MLAPGKRSYDKPVRAKSLWLCSTLCNPMGCIACWDPLAMGFSRQEYSNGLPCPLQGIFPNQGLNPGLLHYREIDSLLTESPGKPKNTGEDVPELGIKPYICIFLGGSDTEESVCNARNLGSIPESGRRSPGEGNGNTFQYSCLENPHGQRSLVDYSPWVSKKLYMTE